MHSPTLRSARARRPGRAIFVGLLAAVLSLLPASPPYATAWLGVTPALAQGGMDIGILLPSFSDLPLSVQPGQTFPLVANTAPGASCVGQVTFRNLPPIDLDAQAAPNGTCTWDVAVPGIVRPSTATIDIDISRGGQGWSLAGVFYVNAIGENR